MIQRKKYILESFSSLCFCFKEFSKEEKGKFKHTPCYFRLAYFEKENGGARKREVPRGRVKRALGPRENAWKNAASEHGRRNIHSEKWKVPEVQLRRLATRRDEERRV